MRQRCAASMESIQNFYDAMIGRISFSPDNHCALTGDQRVMATLSSGRDPRSLGVFRERA